MYNVLIQIYAAVLVPKVIIIIIIIISYYYYYYSVHSVEHSS